MIYFPLNISLLPTLYFLFFPSYKSPFSFSFLIPFSKSFILFIPPFFSLFSSFISSFSHLILHIFKFYHPISQTIIPFSLLSISFFFSNTNYSILHSLPTSSLFSSFYPLKLSSLTHPPYQLKSSFI